MTKKPEIRFIAKNDLPQLIELCQLHAEFEQSEYSRDEKEVELESHLFSNHPSVYCLVVEHNKELVGYVTYMKQFSTWDAEFYIYMDCLFMKDTSRGLGIGEQLIEKIKAEGKKIGCSIIEWQTPNFNTRAIKFYNRIGASSKSKERFFLKL